MSKLSYLIISSFWGVLTFLVFFSSLKEQVIISKKLQQNISMLFPEGWGFFTKSPREQLLYVFNVENKNEKKPIMINNFSCESYFGLSRKARYIGFEGSDIVKNIPPDKWMKQEYQNFNRLRPKNVFVLKKNKNYRYFKNGLYLFMLKSITPYAWAKENQDKFTPITFAYIMIE